MPATDSGHLPAAIRLPIPQAIERAAALQRRGLLADAEKIYGNILKLEPKHFDALHLLAVARYQQGRYREALPLYERARAVKSDSAELLSN
jgi:tetratricopeptide (TPR) repeat protein